MNEFAALVKEQRERKRIRAYDLAYQLGQVPSWVTRLESGKLTHPPAPNVMRLLSDALDIPETEMLKALGYISDPDEESGTDQLGASIARAVQGWTPTQKKLLWQYIEAVSTALDDDETGEHAS